MQVYACQAKGLAGQKIHATFAAFGRAYCMCLTHLTGVVVSCRPGVLGRSDVTRDPGYATVFQTMQASGAFFTAAPSRRLLDIGCGLWGSDFVNRFAEEFGSTQVVSLDLHRPFLFRDCDRLYPVCADAIRLPFATASFHLAFAGGIISNGVLAAGASHDIAAEAFRVLMPGGVFVFTHYAGQAGETISHLAQIGFGDIAHLFRINWIGCSPEDVYTAQKPVTGSPPSFLLQQ